MAKVNIELEIIDALDMLAFTSGSLQCYSPQNPLHLIYINRIQRIYQSIQDQLVDKCGDIELSEAISERAKEDADLF